MSIFSNHSLHIPQSYFIPPSPQDSKSSMIDAIGELDLEKVMDLLDQGVDPLMDIPANEKIVRALLDLTVISRTGLEVVIGSLFQQVAALYFKQHGGSQIKQGVFSIDLNEDFTSLARQYFKNEGLADQFLDFIRLGSNEFAKLPDEVLRTFYIEFSIQDILNKNPKDVVPFKLTEIACMLRSLPLMEKLDACGVDITDPKSYGMGGLYPMIEQQLIVMLEKLHQQGEEVPFKALTDPSFDIHERIEKILVFLQLQGIELPEIYNNPYEINAYELSRMSLNDLAYVDFILSKGIPKEKVFNLNNDFIYILQSKDCNLLLDYLQKRGFDLEGFFFQSPQQGFPTPLSQSLLLMSENLDVNHAEKVALYLIDLFPAYFKKDLPKGHFLIYIGQSLAWDDFLPYLSSELSDEKVGAINLKYEIITRLMKEGVSLETILYHMPETQKCDEIDLLKLGVIALYKQNMDLLEKLETLGLKVDTQVFNEKTKQSFSLSQIVLGDQKVEGIDPAMRAYVASRLEA